MITAKFDRNCTGKRLRFIVGNTASNISGAFYVKRGTNLEDVTIQFLITPEDESIFNYRNNKKDEVKED